LIIIIFIQAKTKPAQHQQFDVLHIIPPHTKEKTKNYHGYTVVPTDLLDLHHACISGSASVAVYLLSFLGYLFDKVSQEADVPESVELKWYEVAWLEQSLSANFEISVQSCLVDRLRSLVITGLTKPPKQSLFSQTRHPF